MATRRLLALGSSNAKLSAVLSLQSASRAPAEFIRSANVQQSRCFAAATPEADSQSKKSSSQMGSAGKKPSSDAVQKQVKGENGGSSNVHGGEEAGSSAADGSYRSGSTQKGKADLNIKGSAKGGFDQSGGDKSQSPSTRGATPNSQSSSMGKQPSYADDLSTAGPKSGKSSSSKNKQSQDHEDVTHAESGSGSGKRRPE